MKRNLVGITREEAVELCHELGESSYRADQLLRWIYIDRVNSIDEMTNLPKRFREILDREMEIKLPSPVRLSKSSNDDSLKLLLRLNDGAMVETVLMPSPGRLTICISTQVGCALGCRFCRTGEMGFRRNLLTEEIVGQMIAASDASTERISNIVFMGMGEPLLNFDNVIKSIRIFRDEKIFAIGSRKLTLSTAGIVKGLKKIALLRPALLFGVAVSLNAPNQNLREKIMPYAADNPLDELIEAARGLARRGGRGLTFEYVLLHDINDKPEHAKELCELLQGIECKVNLIPFNPYPGALFQKPSDKNVKNFMATLVSHRFPVTVRSSLGSDILGACGQLATRELEKIDQD